MKNKSMLSKTLNILKDLNLFKSSPNRIFQVGKCPHCNRKVIEYGGVYTCSGYLIDKCEFKTDTHLDGEYLKFKDVLKYKKYKEMDKAGYDKLIIPKKNKSTNPIEETSIQEESAVDIIVDVENVDKNQEVDKNTKDTSLGKCPKCDGNIFFKKPKYSCDKCDYILNNHYSKTKIKPSEIETLLKGDSTNWIKFTNKKGEKFEGKLVLDKETYNYSISQYQTSTNTSNNTKKEDNKEITNDNKNKTTKDKNPVGCCPVCKKAIYEGKTTYGCIGIKDKSCAFKIPLKYKEMPIKVEDIKELLKGHSIVKKNKSKSEIYISLNKDNNLEEVPF